MEFEAANTNLEAAVQRKEALLNCELPCQVDSYRKNIQTRHSDGRLN